MFSKELGQLEFESVSVQKAYVKENSNPWCRACGILCSDKKLAVTLLLPTGHERVKERK